MIRTFSVSRLPQVVFGDKALAEVPDLAATLGNRLLVVTGQRSFVESVRWPALKQGLEEKGLSWEHVQVSGEPSPEVVDGIVDRFGQADIDAVLGIGGGSVLDVAKAAAGLLETGNSVVDHLEGVGPELPYRGPAIPWIAVPTTAGTGSEATRNAVLSVRGPDGFKKSFRDERLVAAWAVIDPSLLESCPRPLIAADGMDALTQLIESYVSPRASPFSDSLALEGVKAVRDSLLTWHAGVGELPACRHQMALAAWLSGITLAQAGLGAVHGLASPLGAYYSVPHGVVCGTLLATATRMNIQALRQREPEHSALARYALLGDALSGTSHSATSVSCQALIDQLSEWSRLLDLPRLREYGVRADDFEKIVRNSRGGSMKTNPLALQDEELIEILGERL
ncbi:MAG: iron-containing alcohol dehydrogenase [Acidobacteriota bacterium]